MPSKQLSRSQMDAAIFKAGIRHHHDEIREALGGTLYSGRDGNLRKRLINLQAEVKGIFTDAQRHIIQEEIFPGE